MQGPLHSPDPFTSARLHSWALLLLGCSLVLVLPAVADDPQIPAARAQPYEISFSILFGGNNAEQPRGIVTDPAGNIVVVGGTKSYDFPTTLGPPYAHGGHGPMEIFVIKLDPAGKQLWSRLMGGPNHDRAYDVEVDQKGNIFICGRAGPGFPTTEGALQTVFGGGDPRNAYGPQDGFVAKLSPDGETIWSTYFGGPDNIELDRLGDIAISLPQVERQAAENGKPPERELAMLTVHGVLHLLGYDHAEPDDEKIMFGKTDVILQGLFGEQSP